MPQDVGSVNIRVPHTGSNIGRSLGGANASVNPYCETTRRRLIFHLSSDSQSIDRTPHWPGRVADSGRKHLDRRANHRWVAVADHGRPTALDRRDRALGDRLSEGPAVTLTRLKSYDGLRDWKATPEIGCEARQLPGLGRR